MSKIKIGLIDWFIDEFHATYYVQWFNEMPEFQEFEIHKAWEHHAKPEGRNLKAWCKEFKVPSADSMQEVLDSCDVFLVLAPSNPEVHEELVAPVLATGKPVYLDKPFASTKAAAERIFAMADRFGTPLWSSSALRFSDEIIKAKTELFGGKPCEFASVMGGGSSMEEYLIHLVEMLVVLQGADAKRVMYCGKEKNDLLLLDYADNRCGAVTMLPSLGYIMLARDGEKVVFENSAATNIFWGLLREMLKFFKTGIEPVPRRETIAISGIVEKMLAAAKQPGTWVYL